MAMTVTPPLRALLDGEPADEDGVRLAITDDGVARGDGAFETVGVWDGRPFRWDDHLDRLDASLAKTLLPPADRAAITADRDRLLDGLTIDGALRCYVTASGTRVLTLSPGPTSPPGQVLMPQPAPWIQPPAEYEPAGAKTMSYGPNMAASRAARRDGGDDALLVASDGTVLEGPTFCVLWVSGGTLCTAPVDRGIVDSISRRTLLELADDLGIPTRVVGVPVPALADASEVLICSAVRDVASIGRIGPHVFDGPTPVRDALSGALDAARRGGRRPAAGAPP
ncbi:hypothetical protein ER308_07555 [Egibacter rhizosphaerae]|uniref:4-amino-4-deoxychorismate lyase n=1 Tax=Egibacter rhizosphaerae TaxID=1670831 RepID=A0A411YDZ9_9ACTN|nr:aminotransferase class IV [Egibacter rhizosphaerae]QBI19421.1 hypothetical protein ER308_07555 [Egibacter rhizosphaerae]